MAELLQKSRILIVDDQKTNIDILKDILADYDRRIALNGKQALKIANSDSPPDLILLDIMMPGMDGYEVCKRLKEDKKTQDIAIIFVTAKKEAMDEKMGFDLGAVDYVTKPFNPAIIKRRVQTQLELKQHRDNLQALVNEKTEQLSQKVEALEHTEIALRDSMQNLLVSRVANGVFWLQIPEVEMYILCGCPGEVVKHLMRKGFINTVEKDGVVFENGPNVILLSDLLVQNGDFANLSEFPVLQMLYRQGMILPGHPNNNGSKPMLIGSSTQVQAQMEYIHRGKHGLVSKEEFMACGIDEVTAQNMMNIKLKFTFGPIQPPQSLLDTLVIDEKAVEIRDGVTVARIGVNRFQFSYRGNSTKVDLNLPENIDYEPAYMLGYHHFNRQFFSVLHTGEGDGWDINRRSMSSIITHNGRIYLIDAGPGIFQALTALGINISEVEGIFHTHGHDDHFAGLPALIHSDHRLKYFATTPVRVAVAKKFTALMSLKEEKFGQFFDICDLNYDIWNNCQGLEVMPIYSPHPTETTLLKFRVKDKEAYKSYAHWADLSSFKVLDQMVGDGIGDVPVEFMEKVKQDYLQPADLKKVDIGGGQIHGLAEDFIGDNSNSLILSHCERDLTIKEKEIGSDTYFGAMDVLIPGNYSDFQQQATDFLEKFFKGVEASQIVSLIDGCPIVEFKAGTLIYRFNHDNTQYVYMILTGTVTYLDSSSGISNNLSFGSFIGVHNLFNQQPMLIGAFRASSHCTILRFSTQTLLEFLEKNDLLNYMSETLEKTWFLRKTWLFGEQTTFLSLGAIVQTIKKVSHDAGSEIIVGNEAKIWLVKDGEVDICSPQGEILERVQAGSFFGEHNYFSNAENPLVFKAKQYVELYIIDLENYLDIPIVHWKMLEIFEKRKKFTAMLHQ
ncbi:MAG: response regulator [Magnetococcales bacterium]|nr:response regulator [Magnetococcales bacterium]